MLLEVVAGIFRGQYKNVKMQPTCNKNCFSVGANLRYIFLAEYKKTTNLLHELFFTRCNFFSFGVGGGAF